MYYYWKDLYDFFQIVILYFVRTGLKVAYKLFPEGLVSGTPNAAVLGFKPKTVKPATRNNFTTDDIDKIEIYLDNALQDRSIGSELLCFLLSDEVMLLEPQIDRCATVIEAWEHMLEICRIHIQHGFVRIASGFLLL